MAASTPTKSPPRKRRIRRRFVFLLLPILLLAIVWKAAESYIDIEHYRPLIDKELELLIELPLSFGAMDLQLFPSPRLVVENVALGEEDFMAFSPRLVVTADLGKLVHRELELHTLTLHELRVQLPESTPDLQARWSEYMIALETPDPVTGAPMLQVTLETITASDAVVYRGDTHYATGNLDVTGVTAGAPVFSFNATGVAAPGEPGAEGSFTLTVDRDPLLQGNATIANLPLANLTGDERLPSFVLDGQIDYSHAQHGAWTFSAAGGLGLRNEAPALGNYTLDARYARGNLNLDALTITSSPLDFEGALALLDGGRWNLDITSAILRDRAIDWLAERIPEVPFRDNADLPSEGRLTNMRMGDERGEGFAIEAGHIAVEGVDLHLGAPFVFPNVRGEGAVGGGAIGITALTSRHIDLAGQVNTDFAADTLTMDIAGRFQLAPDFPLPDAIAGSFRPESGTIAFDPLQATFHDGNLHFSSLQLASTLQQVAISAWDEGAAAYVPTPEATGTIAVREGVLALTDIKGADSVLSASLTPDESLERWAFTGQLQSELSSPLWKPLYPSAQVTVLGGTLESTQLSGAFTADSYMPEALEMAATIRSFSAEIHAGDFEDQIALDTVTLTAGNDQVAASFSGTSGRLGPLKADGALELPSGNVKGHVTLNPAKAPGVPAKLKEGLTGSLIAEISPLRLDVTYTRTAASLQFSASDPIPVSGALSFRAGEQGQSPAGLTLAAAIPANWLAPQFPGTTASGTIDVRCTLDSGNGALAITADGARTEIAWSLLKKESGSPLELALDGQWGQNGLVLSGGELTILAQALPFTMGEGGIANDGFRLDLAPWAPLLPPDTALTGTVEGQFENGLDDIDLHFQPISFTAGPAAPPFTGSGTVRRRAGRWRFEDARWSVGSSRGSAAINGKDGSWDGDIAAARLDLTELAEAYDAIGALNGPTAAGERRATELPAARIRVTADQLAWGKATVDQARFNIESTPALLSIKGFTFIHGDGTGGGRLRYTPARDNEPAMVNAELQLRQVHAALVEALFTDEARGLEGTLDGSADIHFPIPVDDSPLLHGVSGRIAFEAVDGTLGKAGLASRLLTSLRTTDVLRLRIPHLRDRGLTFKELAGEITIESGVFHVHPYAMADSTYVLEADARFDFPADTADGDIQVQVLEGVTGVVGKIPIIGEAANLMNKIFRVPIKITGTANDPGFRVGMPG